MNSCLNSSLGKSSLIRARATFSLILDPFKVDTNLFIFLFNNSFILFFPFLIDLKEPSWLF